MRDNPFTIIVMSPENLYTIGYQGRTVAQLIQTLQKNAIMTLCDVRKNAVSRKPGFSKTVLQSALEAAGIKYVHLPELGTEPKDRPPPGDTSFLTTAFFLAYNVQIRKDKKKQEALEHIKCLMYRNTVALMCYERNVEECHRKIIYREIIGANKEEKHL